MKNRTDVFEEAGSLSPDLVAQRLGLLPFLMLSAWCGLVSGLLEVGVIILRKRTLDFNQLYWMSRHFVWLIPLINLLVFLILGLVLSVLVLRGGGRGRWLVIRLLCALTMLPPIWAASARIYGPAGALLGARSGHTVGPGTGAACYRLSAVGSSQLPNRRLSRTNSGGVVLGRRPRKVWREERGRSRRRAPQTFS